MKTDTHIITFFSYYALSVEKFKTTVIENYVKFTDIFFYPKTKHNAMHNSKYW